MPPSPRSSAVALAQQTAPSQEQGLRGIESLTRKEEDALLDFYGLESLQPQVWSGGSADNLSPGAVSPDNSRATAAGDVFSMAMPLASMETADNKPSTDGSSAPQADRADREWDDSDPLGIKDSLSAALAQKDASVATRSRRKSVLPRKIRQTISTSSREFNPRTFLRQVHGDTSYEELVAGYRRLQLSVEKRQETLKLLVKDNFDRFVAAKSTVENIYKELKSKNLNSEGYGTDRFQQKLRESTDSANAVFRPIIERKQKAESIRSTLSLLERFRFLFNLPASLDESIRLGKYDKAVRDYKKGKAMYLSQVQSTATTTSANPALSPDVTTPMSDTTRAPLKRVFEKVWVEVDKRSIVLRDRVFKELTDMSLSMEQQERNIIFLIDLDVPEDPVWFFFRSQHAWISGLFETEMRVFATTMEALVRAHGDAIALVQRQKAELADKDTASADDLKSHQRQARLASTKFKRSVQAVISNNFESMFAHDLETQAWMAHVTLVRNLSQILTSCLPDFWALCRAYIDGKYDAKSATTSSAKKPFPDYDRAEKCREMLMQLVDIFAAKLGEAFSFLVAGSTSTKAVTASVLSKAWRALPSTAVTVSGTSSSSPSSDSSDPSSRESFIRVIRDQPMALAYFLPQIVSELAAVHTDMQRSVRLNANSGDGTGENRQLLSPIHQLVERIKRGFVEALCAYWVKESALFYTHEDWSISRQTPESTIMLQQFTRFHKLMLRSVYRIIAGNDVTTTSRKNAFPPNLLDRIRTSLFNSMMTLLDGLHFVAMHPTAYSQWTLTKQAASESSGDVICVDPSNKDMRLLTVLGNVVHIRQQLLPTSMKVYELLFKSVAVQEAQKLVDAAELLDNLLFEAYIKRKSTHLTQIIRDGILYAGCNWSSVVRPASVQGYVNELLLCMVFVHAEVTVLDCADNNGSLAMNFASPADTSTHRASSSSFKLTKRVFAALVNDILQTFLSCFRQVEQFGDGGGMLQAWLDFGAVLEVLRTTVEGMPETRGLVRLVQATVTGDSGGMRDELADDMIKHWLKACAVEFQCFTA